MEGRYIVIEGGDGVGKGTQIERLLSKLGDLGITAEQVREPGGDPDGEKIRSVVLDPSNNLLPEAKVLLFNAARVQTLKVIREKLASGIWCLADRSYISTLAYQCYGEGLPLEETETICQYATRVLQPDCIVVLHASFQVVSQRRSDRGVVDWFEQQGEDFHVNVIDGYLELAVNRHLPVVAADATPEEVEDAIWAHIEPLTSTKE